MVSPVTVLTQRVRSWYHQSMTGYEQDDFTYRGDTHRDLAARWDFLRDAFAVIAESMTDESVSGVYPSPSPENIRLDFEIKTLEIIATSSYWNEEKRAVHSLVNGLKDGTVVLRDMKDIEAIYFVFEAAFLRRTPDAVDHFISTGDFLDVVIQLRTQHLKSRSENYAHKIPMGRVQEKFQQLYDYDLNHDTSAMPLEIRLHLSGFYDDVVDHEDVGT